MKLASEFQRGQEFAKAFMADTRSFLRTTPPSAASSSRTNGD